MDFKEKIAKQISIENVPYGEIHAAISVPQEAKNGEYCLPCFKFSRQLKLSPQAIAENLKKTIPTDGFIAEVNAVSGYLNFKLNREKMAEALLNDLGEQTKFVPKAKNGKTICIDYSSINVAKPFHIGHLLTTVIGGSLYRIFNYLGYSAVGINHLGDWGTQFGKLIVAYKKWGEDEDIKKRNIRALLDLYVKFHAEAEKDESLNEDGRRWFKKIEDGDCEALEIFNRFKTVTLTQVQKIYDRLGVKFDSYAGESFYNNLLIGVTDELKQKKLLTESEGAQVVDLTAEGMPPCLILKSDGASLYATRDLAAAKYRFETYNFYKCLYVVAYQQNLHFKQVFAVLEKMGYAWAKDCVHVPFGMVSLENSGALSTRKGNVVFLEDVLNTAVVQAREIMREKSSEMMNADEVADMVGVGAIVFSALSNNRIKDMVFSYEKALNFDGETAPYLQYTHARCKSVLRKVSLLKKDGAEKNTATVAKKSKTAASVISLAKELTDDDAFETVKILGRFEDVVAQAAERYEPSLVARYLIDLAQAYNKFYVEHRIVEADGSVHEGRKMLTDYTAKILKKGLELLLIQAPEQM